MSKIALNNNYVKVCDGIVIWKDIYITYHMPLEEFKKRYDMERYIIHLDAYINKYNISEFIIDESQVAINFHNSNQKSFHKIFRQLNPITTYDIVITNYNTTKFNIFISEYNCYIRNKKLNELLGYGLIKV